jgi:hypothetical protein
MSKFQINKINLISSWGYKLSSNIDCTICRCSLNTNSIYNDDVNYESIVIEGICGHSYHEECINKWITNNIKHCPICSNKWALRRYLNKK